MASRTKRIQIRNRNLVKSQGSSAVASEKAVNTWYNAIRQLMVATTEEDAGSNYNLAMQMSNAWKVVVDAAIAVSVAGPAVYVATAAAAQPAAPAGLDPALAAQITMQYVNQENAYIAIGAGGVPPGTVCPLFRPLEDVPQAEFDSFLIQCLEAMAHSGFSGQGSYTQEISFKVFNCPRDQDDFYDVSLEQVVAMLPEGTTPRKIGAFHANTLSYWLRENDIMLDWAVRHGVPRVLNYLGHAVWQYVTDKTLMNEQQRAIMQQVTNISIRDQASYEVQDPYAPVDLDAQKKAASHATAAYHEFALEQSHKPEASASLYRRKQG